jgi:hypothetical protein
VQLLARTRDHILAGNLTPKLALLEKPDLAYRHPLTAAVVRDWQSKIDTATMVEGGLAFVGGAEGL